MAGVRDVVLIVNFLSKMIEERIGKGKHVGCDITYVKQRRVMGTADAVNASRDQVKREDNFLTVYGDDYYDQMALARFTKKAAESRDMMLACANVRDPSKFGSLTIEKGLVRSVDEKIITGASGPVNAGLYSFNQSIFDALKRTRRSVRGELELTEALEILLRQGQTIKSFPLSDTEWVGLSYPWDLLDANIHAMNKSKPSIMGQVDEGANVKGSVTIARGAVVKSGSYLEGPVLVGEGAMVGPNSYLRPHTVLGRNVKVGAGCEVKNSIVMDNTTIPHLSYLGDSVIGEGCALGAGTITANLRFDEKTVRTPIKGRPVNSYRKKLGAVLGDRVRTGINVSLLPGVKLGTGAWIEPGGVVSKDVPSGARFRR